MKISIIIFFTLRKVNKLEITSSHWRRNNVDWMLASIHSPRGPSMYGINHQLVECMLAMIIIMFKNRIDKYLVKAGYTLE